MSPLTSSNESQLSEYSDVNDDQSTSEDESSNIKHEHACYHSYTVTNFVSHAFIGPQVSNCMRIKPVTLDGPDPPSTQLSQFGYKLVGDNIDMAVKARYIQADGTRNQSLHYFHSFAVKNRVNFSHIPDVHPHTCLPSHKQMAVCLLQSAEDDKKLHHLFLVHVSHIVATYLPYFKFAFEDVVDWHVQYMYSHQMSQKSGVVF